MHNAYIRLIRKGSVSQAECGRSTLLAWAAIRPTPPASPWSCNHTSRLTRTRQYHRLSKTWLPTVEKPKGANNVEDAHSLLVRGGFLSQTHAGIFHLLPLGQRVLSKLESIIDHYMGAISANKVSLSSITSEALWERSGRLQGKDSELFHFQDRKNTKFLLSPTHEEEITSLVSNAVHSYKDLPLRLYQISRKYRDEARPRQGLLRGREFLMKDLYTFDSSPESSRATYEEVRSAYNKIFTRLGVPFLTGAADSGSMGGNISHEYHYPSPGGEDKIIRCPECGDTRNEEVAINPIQVQAEELINDLSDVGKSLNFSRDRKTVVQVWFPNPKPQDDSSANSANPFAVKSALPDLALDTGIEVPSHSFTSASDKRRIILLDPRIASNIAQEPGIDVKVASAGGNPISLTRIQPGDVCAACSKGHVDIIPAIEVGHTFNLGNRYSAPFKLSVRTKSNELVDVQMGCHGIGVSRLMAAIAAVKATSDGLNWPSIISPWSIVVVPRRGCEKEAAKCAGDMERMIQEEWTGSEFKPDVALDDRDRSVGWKLKDANVIGYTVMVIAGEDYASKGMVEIQCRQLGCKEEGVELSLETLKSRFDALEGKDAAMMH